MSVIIVGSVVSGAVGTSLRRIGILKAIGFTPREVVRAYVAQALIPAGVGIALGVVLGNLLAVPLLDDTEQVYGTASLTVAWWVDVVVVGRRAARRRGSRRWSPHCGPDGCARSRPSRSAARPAPDAASGRTGRRDGCRCRAR